MATHDALFRATFSPPERAAEPEPMVPIVVHHGRWAALVTAVLERIPSSVPWLLVRRYIAQVQDEPLDGVIEAADASGQG